ncbi:hypothetical protein DRO41_01085 [Candidatus Bathyarchaeota archaeon]|nr:MAG: hypothetical protein DRO41_01085 [Candidatus Bathyarchaeota archaeon]
MKYLLKLRVRKNALSDEITGGLKSVYNVDAAVTPAEGELQVPGLDVIVKAFNVRDNRTGSCAVFLAVGYEDTTWVKYRIYGDLYTYCPKCKVLVDEGGKYCRVCGAKIEYQIP